MARIITIIACGEAKQTGEHRAIDLYTGSLFCSNRRAALEVSSEVYILSAKYGLLPADALVDDYECRLGDAGCVSQADIERQIAELELDQTEAYVFAGGQYFDLLHAAASALDWFGVFDVHECRDGLFESRRRDKGIADNYNALGALADQLEAEVAALEAAAAGKVAA